jgi:hypothetical protein
MFEFEISSAGIWEENIINSSLRTGRTSLTVSGKNNERWISSMIGAGEMIFEFVLFCSVIWALTFETRTDGRATVGIRVLFGLTMFIFGLLIIVWVVRVRFDVLLVDWSVSDEFWEWTIFFVGDEVEIKFRLGAREGTGKRDERVWTGVVVDERTDVTGIYSMTMMNINSILKQKKTEFVNWFTRCGLDINVFAFGVGFLTIGDARVDVCIGNLSWLE